MKSGRSYTLEDRIKDTEKLKCIAHLSANAKREVIIYAGIECYQKLEDENNEKYDNEMMDSLGGKE